MEAIQLHDKFSEEIIGTVFLKGTTTFNDITQAWDKYQLKFNSESDEDIINKELLK